MANEVPRWLWRVSVGVLVGALLLTGLLLALALAGISDPQPVGSLVMDTSPGEAERVGLSGAQTRRLVTAPHTFRPPGTLELSARLVGGPPEARYGLWWGSGPHRATVVAVSGSGYYAVLAVEGGVVRFIEDWRSFPHVHAAGETNRLRADVDGGQVAVRINDEYVTSFEMEPGEGLAPLQVGFYVEAFGAGGVEAAFERLRVWQRRRE